MRVFLIVLLIAFCFGSVAVYGVRLDPGYVLIAWANTSVEMTAWVFVATLLVFLSLIACGFWLINKSSYLARRIKTVRWLGRDNSIHNMTAKGLAAYEEGHWIRARKLLSRVGDRSDNAVVFYLMCARASHALGDQLQVSEYLRKAGSNAPGASLAISLTQAQLQLEDGSLEACLATLIRAHAADEAHPAVLKMLAHVYEGLRDWSNLNKLMVKLHDNSVLDEAEFTALMRRCYGALLAQASANYGELSAQWRKLPSPARVDIELRIAYVDCLLALDMNEEAEHILRDALSDRADDRLLDRYGKIVTATPAKQLQFAQKLLADKKPSAAAALCCARLAVLNKVVGQAESYFETAYKLNASDQVCVEIARFYLAKGEPDKAGAYLNKPSLPHSRSLRSIPAKT